MKKKFKSISVVGVDGTGKSSTISLLQEKIGKDRSCIQYMGARLWETELILKYREKLPTKNPFIVLVYMYAYIREMYHRYYKYKGDSRIVIFDRYAFEHGLFAEENAKGFKGHLMAAILKFAFVNLYPKPSLTVYLTCPIEVTLQRKSDITTPKEIEAVKRGKEILDRFYTTCPGVVVMDTSIKNQESIVEDIYNNLITLNQA